MADFSSFEFWKPIIGYYTFSAMVILCVLGLVVYLRARDELRAQREQDELSRAARGEHIHPFDPECDCMNCWRELKRQESSYGHRAFHDTDVSDSMLRDATYATMFHPPPPPGGH